GHGKPANRFQIRKLAVLLDKIACDLLDVLPVVAIPGPAWRARGDSAAAGLHRKREVLDLRSGVVVVKLAGDRVALRLEQRRDRVAKRRLAPVADVQRAGRVGRNELDLHLLAPALARAAEAGALFQDAADYRCLRTGL